MKKSIKKNPRIFNSRKKYKNKVNLINYNFNISNFSCGRYGFKTTKSIRLTYYQIEAARKAVVFNYKKRIKFLPKVNFNEPVTSKSIGVRMGKGVGSLDYWVCNIPKGTFLIELSSIYYGIRIKRLYKLLHYIVERIKIPLIFFIRY